MQDLNPLLEAALAYARFGWRVVPLHGIISVPDSDTGNESLTCTCQKGLACRVPGKHPRPIRLGRRYALASRDPATITAWWRRWPNSNVGLATGHPPESEVMPPASVHTNSVNPPASIPGAGLALCVLDIDGVKGAHALQDAIRAAGLTAIPRTLQASSGRRDGGIHLYYWSDICPQSSGNGLDTRGTGGLVVAPPSRHISGAVYRWSDSNQPMSVLPGELASYLGNRDRSASDRPKKQKLAVNLPAYLQNRQSKPILPALKKAAQRATPADVQAALVAIRNNDLSWDSWNRILMTAWACDQSEETLNACIVFSKKSRKFTEGACEERWSAYATSPPTDLGFGTLYHLAREADPDWEPPSHQVLLIPGSQGAASLAAGQAQPIPGIQETNGRLPFSFPGGTLETPAKPRVNGHHNPPLIQQIVAQTTPSNPLIELNNRYAVIGDIGSKCLVMGRVQSKVDPTILVPSFQSFTSFKDRYSSTYITIGQGPDQEPKQLGSHWLKWTGRKTFDGIDLMPNQPEILPGNVLNLWSGFACPPVKGAWSNMRDHITYVLAGGEPQHAQYIFRYAAWAVQHPGERAEVALVFRGGKGSGKGTFANALKRLFGQHGLQIFNSKHLTGSFNGHLRNCLLLFADEAFWAGDKQGESVLKGMLTEPALMIEQKGVDATPWRNRLHVLMSANADWVVPASHDERRYAMFDVSDMRIGDQSYFDNLHNELVSGGLAAMLHDLLTVPLDGWHPRQVIHTAALQQQKARSLDSKHEWMESLLQQGELSTVHTPTGEYICAAATLLNLAREAGGRHARDITANALGRFLNSWGCLHIHRAQGSAWRFPSLQELRKKWESRYGSWTWDISLEKWNERNQ